MHAQHAHGGLPWLVVVLAVGVVALYMAAARRSTHPSRWRVASFICGVALAASAFLPRLASSAHVDLRAHMLQHLLLGMLAPIFIVLAEPLTLLLRSMPKRAARTLVRIMRSAPLRLVSHPVSALVLNVGAMYVLYLTPLYAAASGHAYAHAFLHLHFFAAGCLFTWSIVGLDPIARRASARLRLTVLFVAIATHSTLAKIMYAYEWPRGGGHSLAEIHAAAKLMYYGGDFAELLLAIAFFAVWYQRADERSALTPGVALTGRT